MPVSVWRDPLMYQGGSDSFLGPRDPIPLADPAWGCDMEAEIVVVTGDVPAGIDPVAARETILPVGLTNDVSLRGLIPGGLATGFGFFQSKPARPMSPALVAPESPGSRWRAGKVHATSCVDRTGTPPRRAPTTLDRKTEEGP